MSPPNHWFVRSAAGRVWSPMRLKWPCISPNNALQRTRPAAGRAAELCSLEITLSGLATL